MIIDYYTIEMHFDCSTTSYKKFSTEGCSFGDAQIVGGADSKKRHVQLSSVVSNKPIFKIDMNTIALSVVPQSNRDEVEIQFHEKEKGEREDSLVQITFHFPGEDDEETDLTRAETFHKEIMDTGLIESMTGNIIAEFSKEQGNFVTPRGKYGIQVCSHIYLKHGII